MAHPTLIFVGTYTEPILFGTGKILEGKGEGVYLYHFDRTTGGLTAAGVTPDVVNPSYLAFESKHRFLYVVNELKEFEGNFGGAASAFTLDAATGALGYLNSKPTHGTDPCHLTVHPTGSHLLIANFMSGSICVLPIQTDGSLGDHSDFIQHEGTSVDPVRQAGPHAHAVTFDAAGHYLFVPDLGMDKVLIYAFDPERGTLTPHTQPWVTTAPGAGPRQLVFHPSGDYAYLINELDSTMTAYRYDADQGHLHELQTLSTLPADFEGMSTCAEVQIHPSGRFLYGSNRGHDSIVCYAINQTDGTLTTVDHTHVQGQTPRNFVVDPKGAFALVANQDTDNLVVFRIDPESGTLVGTGTSVYVPTPVCVKFL